MKYFHLVWRNLLRRKIRTTFTALSIFVAFLLFAVLMAIRMAFAMGVEVAGVDRLMVFHKVSIIQPLPLSYWDRIRATPGVATVTHATWFGGIYQDPSNFFAQMAVDPASFLEIYSEYIVPEDQRKAWFEDRMGAVVGRSTLRRFGWKIGDRIPIQGTIWRMPNDAPWTFTIRGVYDVAVKGADDTTFLFQSQALDEIRRRSFGYGMVGWYVIRVSDPAKSAEIADRIDEQFANSEYETKTDSEKAFAQSFANQVGDIGSIMTAIAAAVFFTIVLVAGNTMAQSIRERLNELAVLKTLGYSNTLVLALVLAESLALSALAGGAGLFVGWLFIRQGDPTGGLLPVFGITPQHLALGAAFAVALGIVAGTVPALKAMRLRIVDALRRT